MRAAAPSPFDRECDQWVAIGLGAPLLPIIPPYATTEAHLSPKKGKIPGEYKPATNEWAGRRKWTEREATPADLARWRTWPGAGLGIQTAALTAIDIDVNDEYLAGDITKCVLAFVGHGALVRSRAGSPRLAILFRVNGTVRIPSEPFTLPGSDAKHLVEVLGEGKQIVLAGQHPSGAAYDLRVYGKARFGDFPEISLDALDGLLKQICVIVTEAGGKVAAAPHRRRAVWDGSLDPEQAVMSAVNGRREDWLPDLLACRGGRPGQPWRITSDELGRDLEEDLISYPDSLYDQGAERSYTPVTLAMAFGRVDDRGGIGFGGSPRYGLKDGRIHVLDSLPEENRPARTQVLWWLGACLDGPDVPPDASDDILLARLAATVGLDWQALLAEHARRLGFTPVDDAGAPIPEPPPETWDLAEARRNIKRLAAKRALHPAGYDEWLKGRSFGSDELEDAFEIVDALARTWEPPEPATSTVSADDGTAPAIGPGATAALPRVANFLDITSIPDPRQIPLREYVIYPRLARGDLVSVIGMPGMSKSAFGLFDCLVITSGEERILCGEGNISPERLHEPGSAIFYDAEDALGDIKRRATAMMAFYGLTKLQHTLRLISGVGSGPLWIARRNAETRALVEAEGAALLRKWIVETGAIYAVLGPLAGLAEGVDENAVADLNLVAQILTNIGAETGCCINVIHHTSKSGGAEAGDMNAARGSSAFAAKVRGMTTLTALPEAEAKRLGFTGHGYFVATPAKSNHAPRSDGGVIFKRESVLVGNGAGFADDRRGAFEMSARELLRAEGERVQVLRVVGLRTVETREEVREQKQAVTVDAVSADILKAVGGVGRWPLTDIMSGLVRQFHASQSIRAQRHDTVRDRLKEIFAGDGRTVEHDGQVVRIRMEKAGPKEKDPWGLAVEPMREGMRDP